MISVSKGQIKALLYRIAPTLMALQASYRARRRHKAKFWARQCASAAKIYGDGPIHVRSGPFQGMRYINETVWGPIEPKWIGSYEQELSSVVRQIIDSDYDTIIDIGSADGYYSVGLAFRVPAARVFSYEIDPWSRGQQRRMAALNGVRNIQIGGFCSNEEIDRRSQGRTLIVCDIEGFERDLMDPRRSKSLIHSDMLIELHGFNEMSPRQVQDIVSARFACTHRIEQFSTEPRSADYLGGANLGTSGVGADILDEHRLGSQVWLWMTANEPRSTRMPVRQ